MMSWREDFIPNCSPYFACFKAGIAGATLHEVEERAAEVGISLRQKDVLNYYNGWDRSRVDQGRTIKEMLALNPFPEQTYHPSLKDTWTKWDDLPTYAPDWCGNPACWFPCSIENKPLTRWGYRSDARAELYTYAVAKQLSPCGYVGRNLYAQPMIVLDIDTYHGNTIDEQAWHWGAQWQDKTECWISPTKAGSFHLIFATDKVIKTKHFPYAKLDMLGNAKNQSEALKNKICNGIPRLPLTEEIYMEILRYALQRKDEADSIEIVR